MKEQKEKSALIAMSGGVDSSVAAYLMKKEGFSCMGVNMRLYHNRDIGQKLIGSCCSLQDADDAAEVCYRLNLPFRMLDYTAQFKAEVMDKFVKTYEAGGTPNPCIDCNRYMKFKHLSDFADEIGFDKIVTGHYARVDYDEASGRYLLKKAVDEKKDQSYVLYMLTQEQLSRIRFPLGALTKAVTRQIAEEAGFVNAKKRDSEDICFVPDGDYVAFMERYTRKKYPVGDFLDEAGHTIGRHEGAVRYTKGQRRGLKFAAGKRIFVIDKDMSRNTVTLGEESSLFSNEIELTDVNWITGLPETSLRVTGRTRYHQKETGCTLTPLSATRAKVIFDQPVRAVTRGQAAVFYDGDIVVCGGTIQ